MDLVTYASTITSEKVRFRMKEVRYKLETEQRMKVGTENLLSVVGKGGTSGGDPRMVLELHEKLAESAAKILALTKADHRYAALYVATGEEDDTLMDVRIKSSGRLKISLIGATNLPGRPSLQTDVFAVVNIDGKRKAATKQKANRWDESFEIVVDKAVECEIAVYSKPNNNLCALSWFRISELVEDLRIKYKGNPPLSLLEFPNIWLDLEPSGQVLVKLNFGASDLNIFGA
ncbi:Serine/threonine kinase [Irineochytrium annulatum]|nr:Serine/threonine kinase [Irineochytrium annulatum]